jgi:hypothetical protein
MGSAFGVTVASALPITPIKPRTMPFFEPARIMSDVMLCIREAHPYVLSHFIRLAVSRVIAGRLDVRGAMILVVEKRQGVKFVLRFLLRSFLRRPFLI